jgi:hypothetical protein
MTTSSQSLGPRLLRTAVDGLRNNKACNEATAYAVGVEAATKSKGSAVTFEVVASCWAATSIVAAEARSIVVTLTKSELEMTVEGWLRGEVVKLFPLAGSRAAVSRGEMESMSRLQRDLTGFRATN